MRPTFIALTCIALLMTGCASTNSSRSLTSKEQQQFWSNLQVHCGQAFEGSVVFDTSQNPDFARTPLVMHVRRCEQGLIMIPFHVADDRSRTWIFTQTPEGLRLKHDHRHEDGSEDEITQYGGDTRDPGSATRQSFYADLHTATLIPAASTNIWTVEIVPNSLFAYQLERIGTDRRFRVEFDLTRSVSPPPTPWGH